MTVTINGTTGITNDGGYTGDGVVFADTTPANTLVTTTGGNVGIGTASPNAYGSAYRVVQASATDSGIIQATGTTNSVTNEISTTGVIGQVGTRTNHVLAFKTNDTERARIDTSGRLLVGTTSAPGQTGGVIVANNELFVYNIPTTAGGANCNISSGESNRFYRSTSALKYKQDIRDLESIDINAFRPVRYKSKCENDDQTKDHFGFIADEAAEAGFEELVSRGVDGEVEGFQYDRMTVVLVKKLQEQQAIITALTARVEALEGTQA